MYLIAFASYRFASALGCYVPYTEKLRPISWSELCVLVPPLVLKYCFPPLQILHPLLAGPWLVRFRRNAGVDAMSYDSPSVFCAGRRYLRCSVRVVDRHLADAPV